MTWWFFVTQKYTSSSNKNVRIQMAHHFLDDVGRACASIKRGVVSNQLVKPLAIEKVQIVHRIIENTKLRGCRT